MKQIILALIITLALSAMVYGSTVTLNWQSSNDAVFYRAYYGRYQDIGYDRFKNSSTNSVTLTNLSTNRNYCFKATKFIIYSGEYRESLPSNRQCGKISPHPDYYKHPVYRSTGTPKPLPLSYPANPLPVCEKCHA